MLYITILFLSLFLAAWWRLSLAGKSLNLHPFDLAETLPLRGILAVCVFLTHLCPHLDKEATWLKDPCLWGPPSVACFFSACWLWFMSVTLLFHCRNAERLIF